MRKPCGFGQYQDGKVCRCKGGRGTDGLEGGDLLPPIGAKVVLHVVDGHPARQVAQEGVRVLRHPLVRPVARPEIQDGRPVVAEVLAVP